MMQPHGLLLCFRLLHISNSSVSASLVGHVLYSVDLMSAICFPHYYQMVQRYIYSKYSFVFLMLYQLYHSLSFSTLISSSSLYLKLQPELLSSTERSGPEWAGVEWNYSRIEGFDNKMGNNLGLSSCTVPRSAVACAVAYFRRTELLLGVLERSGID